VAVAVAGIAVSLAACSSGSSLPASGTGSPTAAASGFLQDVASGNLSGACGYELPSQQAECTAKLGNGAAIKISGLGIGNDIVSGNEALVAFEASSFCFGPSTASTTCTSNTSPSAGLPTAANFASAFAASFTSGAPLVALEEQNNQWYLLAAPPSGTTGSTGTPTTGAPTGTSGTTAPSNTGATGSTSTSTTGTIATGTT
jgi:hypothetical protein